MVVVWPAVGVVGHKTRKEKKLHTRVWLRHGARLVGRPGGGDRVWNQWDEGGGD